MQGLRCPSSKTDCLHIVRLHFSLSGSSCLAKIGHSGHCGFLLDCMGSTSYILNTGNSTSSSSSSSSTSLGHYFSILYKKLSAEIGKIGKLSALIREEVNKLRNGLSETSSFRGTISTLLDKIVIFEGRIDDTAIPLDGSHFWQRRPLQN